jgi:hypothetical protein
MLPKTVGAARHKGKPPTEDEMKLIYQTFFVFRKEGLFF